MGINGRFEATQLMFKVSGGEFVVDCTGTDVLPVGVECTQQTVQTIALSLSRVDLERLRKALRVALEKIEKT